MQLQYKSLSFKAASDTSGLQANQFDGYASTFLGPVDSYGHLIAPKAFDASLKFFLEDGLILKEHSMRSAIGKPIEASTDTSGLYIKGQISDTTEGRDCLTLLRDKVIKKMSIGYTTEGYEVLSKDRGIEILGSEAAYNEAIAGLPWWADGLTLLTQIKLYEVSLVAFPANEAASVTGVKSADLARLAARITTERQFEEFLRDAGYSKKEATAIASHGFKALLSHSGRMTVDAEPQEAKVTVSASPTVDPSAEVAQALQRLTATLKG